MDPSSKRLSRPVYEGLPWFYVACGAAAAAGSYALPSGFLSLFIGLGGIIAILGGFVILLRRRDYRELRSRYIDPDALSVASAPEKSED
jgi:hypothetical protein